MQDKVELVVSDEKGHSQQISDFSSYEVESDLFVAADAFSFEHYDTNLPVFPGQRASLHVNKTLEHVGIIDRVEASYDKKGRKLVVSGRDLMGLLCDHHCKDFSKKAVLDGKTVRDVARMLIADIPFIKGKTVEFQDGIERFNKVYDYEKIDPGETVFDVLHRLADGRGLLFYCKPDGTFVLGKPKDRGVASFALTCKKSNPAQNNVLSATMTGDISQAYSEVTVYGQVQGSVKIGEIDGVEFDSPSSINVKATSAMKLPDEFPFYKPQVHRLNKDFTSAKREASRLIEQHKTRMFSLEYTVPGHSQNGKNWRANEIVHIEDENFVWKGKRLSGNFLIHSRTFTRDKKQSITKLKIGPFGKVLDDGSFKMQPDTDNGYAFVEGVQG